MPAKLLFDPKCPFCAILARSLQSFVGSKRLQSLPLDSPGAMELHPDLNLSRAQKAVQVVLENGYLCEGAEGISNALALHPLLRPLKVLYYLPLFRQLADFLYFLISLSRSRCPDCP